MPSSDEITAALAELDTFRKNTDYLVAPKETDESSQAMSELDSFLKDTEYLVKPETEQGQPSQPVQPEPEVAPETQAEILPDTTASQPDDIPDFTPVANELPSLPDETPTADNHEEIATGISADRIPPSGLSRFARDLKSGLSTHEELGYAPELALAMVASVADIIPAMSRGFATTAVALADVDTWLREKVLGKEETRGTKLVRQLFTDAAQNPWLNWTREQKNLALETLMATAQRQGGKLGRITAEATMLAEETFTQLAMLRALNIGFGTSALKGAKWKQSLGAGIRAAQIGLWKALTDDTIPESGQSFIQQKATTFTLTSLYTGTEAVSGWLQKPVARFAVDFVLNSLASATVGGWEGSQYKRVWDAAGQKAIAEGRPQDALFEKLLAAGKIFGLDAIFAAMTKSFINGTPVPGVPEDVRTVLADTQAKMRKATPVDTMRDEPLRRETELTPPKPSEIPVEKGPLHDQAIAGKEPVLVSTPETQAQTRAWANTLPDGSVIATPEGEQFHLQTGRTGERLLIEIVDEPGRQPLKLSLDDIGLSVMEQAELVSRGKIKAVHPKTGQTEFIGQEEGGFQLSGERGIDNERVMREQAAAEEAKRKMEAAQGELPGTERVEAPAAAAKPLMDVGDWFPAVEDAVSGKPFVARLFRAERGGRYDPAKGQFFTHSVGAEEYAAIQREEIAGGSGGKVSEHTISLENPVVVETRAKMLDWVAQNAPDEASRREAVLLQKRPKHLFAREDKLIKRTAEALGHDGAIYQIDEEVVVFKGKPPTPATKPLGEATVKGAPTGDQVVTATGKTRAEMEGLVQYNSDSLKELQSRLQEAAHDAATRMMGRRPVRDERGNVIGQITEKAYVGDLAGWDARQTTQLASGLKRLKKGQNPTLKQWDAIEKAIDTVGRQEGLPTSTAEELDLVKQSAPDQTQNVEDVPSDSMVFMEGEWRILQRDDTGKARLIDGKPTELSDFDNFDGAVIRPNDELYPQAYAEFNAQRGTEAAPLPARDAARWQEGYRLSPEDQRTLYPPGTEVRPEVEPFPRPPLQPVGTFRGNTEAILDIIPKSAWAEHREEAVKRGKKDRGMILEENMRYIAAELNKQEFQPEDAEAAIDAVVRRGTSGGVDKLTRLQLNARLHSLFGGPTKDHAVVHETAQRLLNIDDPAFSLKDLTDDQMRELVRMGQPDAIQIPHPALKQAADILKLALRAENPDIALKAVNDYLARRKLPILTDLAAVAAGGPPIGKPTRYKATEAERAELMSRIPKILTRSPTGADSMAKAIDMLEYPLESDPASRTQTIREIQGIARVIEGYRNKTHDKVTLRSLITMFEQTRYAVDAITSRVGDYRWFENDVMLENLTRQADYLGGEIMKDLETLAKVPPDFKYFLSQYPELNSALKAKLGLAPNETNAKDIADADTILANADGKYPETYMNHMRNWMKTVHDELQGMTAAYARYLEMREFMEVWEDNGVKIAALEARTQRTTAQETTLRNLKKEVDTVLPWRYNPKTKKGEHITVDELLKHVRVYQEVLRTKGPDTALNVSLADLYDSKWGTREFYYMTKPVGILPELQEKPISGVLSLKEGKGKLGTASVPSEVHPRTGLSGLDPNESIYSALHGHFRRLRLAALSYDTLRDSMDSLQKHYSQGEIDKETAFEMNDRYQALSGKRKRVDLLARMGQRATSFFWNNFFLKARGLMWHLRNKMQVGLMASQYRIEDVITRLPDYYRQMRNPNSRLRLRVDKVLSQEVLENRAQFFEFMMSYAPGELAGATSRDRMGRNILGMNRQHLIDRFARYGGSTDESNRSQVFGLGSVIAEHHVARYLEGRLSRADLVNRLMISSFSRNQRLYMRKLLSEADANPERSLDSYERFIVEVAKAKNDNVNGVYRSSGRSLMEQSPVRRLLIGLVSFPRLCAEMVVRNGINPTVQQVHNYFKARDQFDGAALRNGFRTLGGFELARWMSAFAWQVVVGQTEDWSLRKFGIKGVPTNPFSYSGMFGWNPVGPGVMTAAKGIGQAGGFIKGSWLLGTEALNHLFHDDPVEFEAFLDSGEEAVDYLCYFIPVLDMAEQIWEGGHDTAGEGNFRAFLAWFDKTYAKGVKEKRKPVSALRHIIANTDEYQPDTTIGQIFYDTSGIGGLTGSAYRREDMRQNKRVW